MTGQEQTPLDPLPVTGWCWAHDHQDCRSATCECECHDDEPRRRAALADEAQGG